MTRRLGAIAFSVVILATGLGSATPAAEAQFFDELGRRAYGRGQYLQALEAFALVQEIAPSPRALYNMAVCADLGARNEAAFAYYREYLSSGDEDEARQKDATERARHLEARLALVEVKSDPPGAAIYVERKELGQHGVTPRTIVVSPGEQKLILELARYQLAELSVVAERGRVVEATLPLAARLGRLAVDVEPASAQLTFSRDGKPVEARALDDEYELSVGPLTVVASAPGYTSRRVSTIVREGAVARVTVGLSLLPQPTGKLLVSSGAGGADVLVDGKRVAVTPATLSDVSVGTHVIEVRTKARSVRRDVTIAEGRAAYVEVDLDVGQ